MKSGLIIFGVIFLVIGGLLYLLPMQKIKADTTTTGNGVTDLRTSTARLTVPIEWAYASGIIGFVLLLFGLMIPNSTTRSNSRDRSYERVVESKDNIEVDDGSKRTVVRERVHTHKARKED